MKYGLIAAVIAVVALFYFMSQSNKADAERLKQARDLSSTKKWSSKARDQIRIEYIITADMAKHLGLMEKTHQGHQIR